MNRGLPANRTPLHYLRVQRRQKVDFFPTSRSMILFLEARVLDCWRISFDAEDILEHFSKPMVNPPDLNLLWAQARKLISSINSASPDMRIPPGSPWVPPTRSHTRQNDASEIEVEDVEGVIVSDEHGEEAEVFSESEDEGGKKKRKKRSAVDVEDEGFEGDLVLANEILFLQDMGWWIIANHAVPDGEIGRIWEIMKEDYNKRLEEMVQHKGGDFNDDFYRRTLAPNVMEFLRMKVNIESAFELIHRGKTHGAPHLRNEFQQLLRMHKEDELHLFQSGRTLGHASINYFARGYEKLEDGRIQKFIHDSTAYSDITKDVLSGEEHDFWDVNMQDRVTAMLAAHDAEDAANSDHEMGSEMGSDDVEEGKVDDAVVTVINFSDDEVDGEEEEELLLRQDASVELQDEEENEELSEMEEEAMDKFTTANRQEEEHTALRERKPEVVDA
ncbi:hypothetical protein R3P38DRAFT_3329624 [Favolaschia claudopus]|uniref:DUF6589 domain-containing protein n=1 Tax=Favolaschia claudopus TaxID=2862362 RepID=A0AAV9ZXU0_9AGAR